MDRKLARCPPFSLNGRNRLLISPSEYFDIAMGLTVQFEIRAPKSAMGFDVVAEAPVTATNTQT